MARAPKVAARLAGGQSARRLRSWQPPLEHINSAIRNGGALALRRVREMEQSNAYAARAIAAWAGYSVRDGIRPTFQARPGAQRRIRAAWDEWVACCDADGCDTFWGLQELVAREVFSGGEAFIVRSDGDNALGLGLRIYQSEQLPLDKNEIAVAPQAGNEVRDGIEFDRTGRRTAYHFYEQHPGDLHSLLTRGAAGLTTRRVPAEDVIHCYVRQNAGQIRGLSKLAAGMIRLYLLDGYDDAELDRQRIAALFAGFIRKPLDDDAPFDGLGATTPGIDPAADTERDPNASIIDLAPGLLQVLDPGEDISFSDPPQLQGQYEAFQYRNLLAVASAMGLPYHVLTGDVEKANYSSARVAQLDFKVEIGRFQNRCLIDQMGRGVRRWFLAAAAMAEGVLRPGDAAAPWTWNLPRWDWVDTEAEAKAAETELGLGITSRRRVVEARGASLEEIDAEIAADTFRPAGSAAPAGAQAQEEGE